MEQREVPRAVDERNVTPIDVYRLMKVAYGEKCLDTTKYFSLHRLLAVMLTVFWDVKGVVLAKFHPTGAISNSERYCETPGRLRTRLRRILAQIEQPVLQHDSAGPHISARTAAEIRRLRFSVLHHPPLVQHPRGHHCSSDGCVAVVKVHSCVVTDL
jgi:hypothetical protein